VLAKVHDQQTRRRPNSQNHRQKKKNIPFYSKGKSLTIEKLHHKKPLGTPISNRINKIIIKEEGFLPLIELDAITTQQRSTVTLRMWLQMKKETKQRD
jgi:hypothetical protein